MPTTPSSTSRGGSSRGGSSRRAAPTKVAKPFPWGTVLGSVVLALVLGGILVFAALNTGSGRNRLLTEPDKVIKGVSVASGELSRNHVQGPVIYKEMPPNAGEHNAAPQQCAVYTAPIAPEHAVHSLEHGAVWVTYASDVPADQVEELTGLVSGDPYRLMSPVPDQDSPIVLTAWGRTLKVDSASDERVEQFLTAYTNGPQSPERGAACVGNTTTGPVAPAPPAAPAAPGQPSGAPAGSGAPAPSPATQ